jgi:type II secretory pathway pseudopilin PulG
MNRMLSTRQGGFGLIEAIVALTLLGVALGSLLPAFAMNLQVNTLSELRTGAIAVAQQELDDLRATSTWPPNGTVRTVQTGAATYEAVYTIQGYCEGAICYSGARRVAVEVRHNGRPLYRVQTVYTLLDETGI